MESKKSTGLIVLVVIMTLVIVGLAGFIVYDKVLKEDTKVEEKESSNVNEEAPKKNAEKLVTRESINELAKNNTLNIDNNFNDVDKIAGLFDENDFDDYVYLSIDNKNKLILKHDNNSSIISNLEEDVVMLYNANVGCQTSSYVTLILTSEGNLYSFKNNDIISNNSSYYEINNTIKENIINGTSSNITLSKINKNKKIVAFTKYSSEPENNTDPITCGGYPPVVYSEDGELFIATDNELITFNLDK